VNFVQHAGVEALSERTDETVVEMREAFRERRDMLLGLFEDHDVEIPRPDGAFYMMPKLGREDDQAWCEDALERAQVATVPGSAFGAPGYARISYAASETRLREAVDRLADADLI
jgi:aspartate aminotransferase